MRSPEEHEPSVVDRPPEIGTPGNGCSLPTAFSSRRLAPEVREVSWYDRPVRREQLGVRRSVVATASGVSAMGQRVVESELIGELESADPSRWVVVHRSVRPWRSPGPNGTRLPLRLVSAAPTRVQRVIGGLAYGRSDVVHRLDLRALPGTRPEVLTVHDLAPLRFDDEGVLPDGWRRSITGADAVTTGSAHMADEIVSECGTARPVVVPHGFDPRLLVHDELTVDDRRRLGIHGRFVLHAGGATARKNLEGLADAWRAVSSRHPDVQLVLCGPPHPRRDELFGGVDRCLSLGRVPRPTMIGLLRAATMVVVPSLYEGFGLPVLEATVVGVPVVTARRSSLPEVAGPGAILVEPDGDGIAGGIERCLTDPPAADVLEAARQRALGFTWERAAAAYLDIYDRLVS